MTPRHPALVDHIVSREQIATRVAELGAEISEVYAGRELKLTCVLKGGFIFLADLVRAITIPCAIDFMVISSYGSGTQSSGIVRILKDLDAPIEGMDVLVVEVIVVRLEGGAELGVAQPAARLAAVVLLALERALLFQPHRVGRGRAAVAMFSLPARRRGRA